MTNSRTDELSRMLDYPDPGLVYGIHPGIDPNDIIEIARTEPSVDWQTIARKLIDLFALDHSRCIFFEHELIHVRWLDVFESVFDNVPPGFRYELTLPIKELELRGKSHKVANNLSNFLWLPDDEKAYPFLFSNGVDILTEATPEAVFVHCQPAVSDLIFLINGWNKEELRFTRGQINQCAVASESPHAIEWAFHNCPELLSLEKIDMKRIRTPEFERMVKKLKRLSKKQAS